MMLNRQKILLSYIHLAGKVESKTVLTKSMFLLCKEELGENSFYDFFPYNFGPYSFCMDRIDVQSLINKDLISDFPYQIKDKKFADNILSNLDEDSISAISNVYSKYGKMRAWQIKNYVYDKYPYFAIRNEKDSPSYSNYDPANSPKLQEAKIFTTGYEGKSLDRFLDELIKNNVKILVDVRKNPRSMKYGFSGNTIRHYAEKVNIKYVSVPELGIEGQHRQNLETQADYDKLFVLYKKKMLPKNYEKLKTLKNLIEDDKRMALMCFEKDYKQCHRGVLSEEFKNYCNNEYGVLHI